MTYTKEEGGEMKYGKFDDPGSKRIINRIRYDTTKSDLISYWDNGCSQGDFGWCQEWLYKTPKRPHAPHGGSWFLHGLGGPASRYASCGEGDRASSDGGGLIPLTENEAIEWCEEHDQEALEEHFKEKIQDA
jgi:hypothetical protein